MINKKKDPTKAMIVASILYIVGAFTFVGVMAYGWLLNIMTVFAATDAMSTGQFVVRAAGIFLAPLGGIMGYIGV